ncbi:MAG: hypothetical protein ACYC5K_05910, partial [Saccharofermentanales bacterium]
KSPDNQYRPIPFWSWNEKLNCDETRWQIDEMNRVGIGGYFMHARGGLSTSYMGEEWMDNVRTGIREGRTRSMGAWGYDENGWPSGFGDGEVNGLGVAYQQKYLRYEITESKAASDRTIANVTVDGRNCHFYFDINPFYVDTLDPEVTRRFIEAVYERYKTELGADFSAMSGFFTDEPQISRNGIPWSFVLEEAYANKFHEKLSDRLPDLFFHSETSARTRFNFWQTVGDLFARNYMKQIYDWCSQNGVMLTGHMVLEDTLHSQLTSNGSCMPNYEYMHIPGMDWLGRSYTVPAIPLQLSSVGHQLGKRQMLSETFALCGWNVGFEELKWIYEAQMVRGVNLLCQHLEGYTLRGIRKRDYPATLFYQQPWWGDYRAFNDAMSRIGYLLTEGAVDFPVLLLHPQSSAWILYDDSANAGLDLLDSSWNETIAVLEDCQIPFHLGDEKIIERYGSVENDRFAVGTQKYRAVVIPPMCNISRTVFDFLAELKENGGELFFVDEIPAMIDGAQSSELAGFAAPSMCYRAAGMAAAIREKYCRFRLSRKDDDAGTECRLVNMTFRSFDRYGFDAVYVVSRSDETKALRLTADGAGSIVLFDALTGDLKSVPYAVSEDFCTTDFTLYPHGSAMFFCVKDCKAFEQEFVVPEAPEVQRETEGMRTLSFDSDSLWEIRASDENALLLDYCDCYFDGVKTGEHIPVNNIQEMACSLHKEVSVDLVFRFFTDEGFRSSLTLVMETPDRYQVRLNDVPVDMADCGYYRDKSFRKIRLHDKVVAGENIIVCSTVFRQRPAVYENIAKSLLFESEKNKLTYDDEIECIALIGDFTVRTPGRFIEMDRNAVRYEGGFILSQRTGTVLLRSIVDQGFPFYSGKITLSRTITLTEPDCLSRLLRLKRLAATVVKVKVNGIAATTLWMAPYEVLLDGYLKEGENRIELEFIGTLRNLLGPHHLLEGESYAVSPSSFFQESMLWNKGKNSRWTDSYCFVDFVAELL